MRRLIDDWLPSFDESEFHTREVAAEPAAVEAALRELRSGDLRLTGLLMGIRTLPALLTGRRGPRANGRLIDGVLAAGFVMLDERPGEQMVLGVVGRPWRPRGDGLDAIDGPEQFRSYDRPGSVRCAWDFVLEPAPRGGGTLVATETRIAGTDAAGTRTFRRYWRLVQPGSALIRLDILRAVARRAASPD
ncbi:MAG TPA: hypothetical protein VGC98_09260 [Thermoleophilaceae bacterium]